jgi:spore maturation protein CgeB
MTPPLRLVFIGLSITSSWGNGHATTYRSLLAALARRGHLVRFLERDVPWYAEHRDSFALPGVQVALYDSLDDLRTRFGRMVRTADAVIVGSYVPQGDAVGAWVLREAQGVRAFYDIDTPITLSALEQGRCEYLSTATLGGYDLYLSFTGGRALADLEALGARRARPLYCGVDVHAHAPRTEPERWDLGYLGTYAVDRQPALEALLLDVARAHADARFVVAGPLYPPELAWPANVARMEHVAPPEHSRFYARQRWTLNLTRADMKRLGHAPSVRLFEAAACGVPVITDTWAGLEDFFEPGREIVPASGAGDVTAALWHCSEPRRRAIGEAARRRVLASHTADARARALEDYVEEALATRPIRELEPLRRAAGGSARIRLASSDGAA